jgi:hypothetical protein
MFEANRKTLACANCGHERERHIEGACPVVASCKEGCVVLSGENICRGCGRAVDMETHDVVEQVSVGVPDIALCCVEKWDRDCPIHGVRLKEFSGQADPEAQVNALENTYADFITRECAAVGMLHASMASLVPVSQLDALSMEELEMVQHARDLLHKVHGFVLARADYRKQTLGRIKEVMENGG